MLVQVNDVGVGPTIQLRLNSEIPWSMPLAGRDRPRRRDRPPRDFNPERFILNDVIEPDGALRRRPLARPGATVASSTTRSATSSPHDVDAARRRRARARGRRCTEATSWRSARSTSRTSHERPAGKFEELAGTSSTTCRRRTSSPWRRSRTTTARRTTPVVDDADLKLLIAAIVRDGGPDYEYRQIDPVDGQDGGAARRQHPRQGSCSAPIAGWSFVDRRDPARRRDQVVDTRTGAADASARAASIPPTRRSRPAASRSSASSASGRAAVRDGEPLRLKGQRRAAVRALAAERVTRPSGTGGGVLRGRPARHADPQGAVIVMGDLNDFEFSATLEILEGAQLVHA